MLTSIFAAVLILGLLIIVHEVGHFLMAKKCGVRVLRFSIGYPPRLFGLRRGETEYAIGATPFGGYVKMLGDEIGDESGAPDVEAVQAYLREISGDLIQAARATAPTGGLEPEEPLLALVRRLGEAGGGAPWKAEALAVLGREIKPDEALLLEEVGRLGSAAEAIKSLSERRPLALVKRIQERAFPSQPLSKRLLIVLAGPLANIVFAPVVLAALFMYGVPRLVPILGQIKTGLPAAAAGLRVDDRVVSINGHPTDSWEELSATVKRSDGAPLTIEFERREGNTYTRKVAMVKPAREEEKTAFGGTTPVWIIGVLPRGDTIIYRVGPLSAIGRAFIETGKMTAILAVGIAKIVDGSTPVRQALGGPIMIAQLAGREAQEGLANIALFTVMISIELGIINLLPVPMLDGGHLLFFVIEGLRGKPLQVRHREIAQQVGLFLLVVLMAFVIFNDISRIVQG